jgi:DNA helicase-2/ATP-dependent DNA helicase PcrA
MLPSPVPTAENQEFDILSGLNPAQRLAVETLDGPVLVLAGAGTGKTRVLTTRLALILLSNRANPFQIMSVTFTNKAAREMQTRVSALVGRPTEGWFLGTFHALAARILRKHAERISLKTNFTILGTDDQLRLIKQILEAENVDTKRTPPRMVLGVIERWKDRGYTPEKVPASEVADGGRFLKFYTIYQERLRTLNACDFGDLLLHNLTLLQGHLDLLQEYQHRFRYILVDEYQDTNVAQYLWLRLLMLDGEGQGRNICCVGDEDQSIYGWRGAEIGNILRFEKDFPGAQIIRLEQNYRSTGHILGAASSLIAHNRDRLGKTLWTSSEEGEEIRVQALWDGESEARFVGDEIEAYQRKGLSLDKMAVLVRAGYQTREFEERFLSIGVPYRVIGGPRFYERQEIRDALAYLRLIQSPEDDLAFERIINMPKRGVGPASLQLINQTAREQGTSLIGAVKYLLANDGFKAKLRTTLQGLIMHYDRWRDAMADIPHTDMAERVLEESGYIAMWQAEKGPDAAGRLENLKELINAMAEFDTLQGFLEHVSLVMEVAEGQASEQVTLMTLHAAKGLEFDVVFLPGWEEEIFPSRRSLEENGMKGLEEERRLAYVGLTRARKSAVISHVANRLIHGSWNNAIPSRFISELPKAHVREQAQGGMFRNMPPRMNRAASFESGAHHYPARPRPQVIEGRAREITRESASPYARGARVFHQKFGYGTVVAVEGSKLEVDFDQADIKKIMADFVVPEDQAGQE